MVELPHPVQFLFPDGFQPHLPDVVHRGSQTRQAVGVEGAGFQCGGHLGWVVPPVGLYSAAPAEQRPHGYARPHIQAAGALGSQQAFVAGEAENVDLHLLDINGKYARCLRSVRHQQQAMTPGQLSHLTDIYQVSSKVGAMGAYDGPGVGLDGGLECLHLKATLPVCRQNGQFHAPILHFIEWAQNRIVLHSSGDDMISRLQDPFNGYVQGFRGVGRKGDLLRALGVKQFCQSQSGIKDHTVCIQGSLVCPTARVAQAAQGAGYRFHHTVRFMPGGGGIVQINHLATSYTRQRYTRWNRICSASSKARSAFSLSGGALQASPQPAETLRGTGIIRPSAFCSRHRCSMAMASVVV